MNHPFNNWVLILWVIVLDDQVIAIGKAEKIPVLIIDKWVNTQMKLIPDQGMWYSENKTRIKSLQQGSLGAADTKFYIGLGRKKPLQRGNIWANPWIIRCQVVWTTSTKSEYSCLWLFSPNAVGGQQCTILEALGARGGPWSHHRPLQGHRPCHDCAPSPSQWEGRQTYVSLSLALFVKTACSVWFHWPFNKTTRFSFWLSSSCPPPITPHPASSLRWTWMPFFITFI